MARKPTLDFRNDQAELIGRLEKDLYFAREAIISLAPDEFRDLLGSHYRCEPGSEVHRWLDMVVESIVDRAVPLSNIPHPEIFGERAFCPLCREGAQSYYSSDAGFKLPEGLRRHLVGYGRSRQCAVTQAAYELARQSNETAPKLNNSIGDAAELQKARRMEAETLYVLGPSSEGVLIDDGWFHSPRPDGDGLHSLKWAEQRLFSLGFQIGADNMRRSYTKAVKHVGGNCVVYADPRNLGKIHFRVFPSSSKMFRKGALPLHQFKILDKWKSNLEAKVVDGVDAAYG